MLDKRTPEALFGADAVGDKKKLRREYAKLIKRFRPETSPDEFAHIHGLYQRALEALKGERANRLADLEPPPDPEDFKKEKRAPRVRADEAPPKWERPEREDRAPEPPPEWDRPEERERPEEGDRPEWQRVEERKAPDGERPEWKRVEERKAPDGERPEWKRVEERKAPDGERPEWKRVEERKAPEGERPEWRRAEEVPAHRRPGVDVEAALAEAWSKLGEDDEAAIAALHSLVEAAPEAAKAWIALAAAVSRRDQAPPREPLRAALRSPARDAVVAWLVDLADESPDGFFAWMDPEIVQAATRAPAFHELAEQWWTLTLAFGKPKAIQAAATALMDLPVRFDEEFRVGVVCDAAENALWAGRGPWLKRWRKEVHQLRSDDRALVKRLDSMGWLLEHQDEVVELLQYDDMAPVIEFLRTGWQLPDAFLRGPWQRHLVGLRDFNYELEQLALDLRSLAPGLFEMYTDLLKRVPMRLDPADEVYIRGWLQRQEQVIDQHPIRLFGHLKWWWVYLPVLLGGFFLPPLLLLAIPAYKVAEGRLRYRLYNEYVRRAFAHLCRTRGYARLEVLHVLEKTRLENLKELEYTLQNDLSIDIEGATLTRNT